MLVTLSTGHDSTRYARIVRIIGASPLALVTVLAFGTALALHTIRETLKADTWPELEKELFQCCRP